MGPFSVKSRSMYPGRSRPVFQRVKARWICEFWPVSVRNLALLPATPRRTAPADAGRTRTTRTAMKRRRRTDSKYRQATGLALPLFERAFSRGKRRCRIAAADVVDECGQALGQLAILDLEDVFGVPLAGVREVEASHEDVVVGRDDLGVHVVVHVAMAIRRRVLARKRCLAEDRKSTRLNSSHTVISYAVF